MSSVNASVLSAVESLTDAIHAHIIPNQEYLLQGSILDSSVEHLLHRLRGLCDNVDTGPEQFHDHEMCLSMRTPGPVSLFLEFDFYNFVHFFSLR